MRIAQVVNPKVKSVFSQKSLRRRGILSFLSGLKNRGSYKFAVCESGNKVNLTSLPRWEPAFRVMRLCSDLNECLRQVPVYNALRPRSCYTSHRNGQRPTSTVNNTAFDKFALVYQPTLLRPVQTTAFVTPPEVSRVLHPILLQYHPILSKSNVGSSPQKWYT